MVNYLLHNLGDACRKRGPVLRYGLVALLLLLTAALRGLLNPLLGEHMPFAFFLPGVLMAAWYGGTGPALLAAVGGALLADYFYIPPYEALGSFSKDDLVLLASYILNSTLLILVMHWMHLAHAQAISSAEAAKSMARQLQDEVQARQTAELALRDNFKTLQHQAALLDLAPVVVEDLDQHIILWNTGAERLYGYSRDEAFGRFSYDLLKTSSASPLPQLLRQVQETGLCDTELVQQAKGGTQIVVQSRWLLHRDPNGKPQAVVQMHQDITQRKNAEQALEVASREAAVRAAELQGIFEAVRDPIIVFDPAGKPVKVNSSAMAACAEDPACFSLEQCARFSDPLQADGPGSLPPAGANGKPPQTMLCLPNPRGGGRVFEVSTAPLNDPDHQAGAVAVWHDVTEREHLTAALERSNARFEAIFNSLTDAIIFADTQRQIVSANPAVKRLFGYTVEELVGRSAECIYANPADFAEHGRQRYSIDLPPNPKPFEAQYRRKDGSTFLGESVGVPVKDPAGHVLGFVGIHRDITQRKEWETRLAWQASFPELNPNPAVEVNLATGRVHCLNPAAKLLSDLEDLGIEHPWLGNIRPSLKKLPAGKTNARCEVAYRGCHYMQSAGLIPGTDTVRVYGVDITERKMAEQRLGLLCDCASQLLKAEDPSQAVEPICRKLLQFLDSDVFIQVLNHSDAVSEKLNAFGGFNHEQAQQYLRLRASSPAPNGDHPSADTPELHWLQSCGVLVFHSRPLKSRGRVFGSLGLGRRTRRPFNDTDLAVIQAVADQLAIALERKHHQQALAEANQQLENRVAERTRALRSASNYARSLLEASLDPLVTISSQGLITDVNKATELATGCARDQLVGHQFSSYFTEPEKAGAAYQKVIESGVLHDYPLTLKHVSGRHTDVLYNATVYRNEDGEIQGVFAAARDVTALKTAERRRELTNGLLGLFAQKTSLQEYLDAVIELLRAWSGAEAMGIRIPEQDQSLSYVASAGFSPDFLYLENHLNLGTDDCCCTRMMAGQKADQDQVFMTPAGSYRIDDSQELARTVPPTADPRPRYKGTCARFGYGSVSLVPIRYRGTVMAVLHLAARAPGRFSAPTVDLLESLAPLIGEALVRFQAEAELARYRGRLEELVQERTRELEKAKARLDLDVVELTKTREALRASEERQRLIFDALPAAVFAKDLEGRYTFVNRQSELWMGLKTDRILGQTDAQVWPPQIAAEFKATDQRVLEDGSVIEFEHVVPYAGEQHTYLVTKLPLLDASGKVYALCGTSTDITPRKRAQDALRASNLRLELLADTASKLLKSDSPQRVVDALCQKALAVLDCDLFINFLVDESSQKLHLNAYAGIPQQDAAKIEWLDFGVAVCGCAARDACRIVAEDIPHTPDPRTQLVKGYGIQAYACHPLLSGDKVLGTLSFGTRNRPFFHENELAAMKAVADHVAIAMERMLAKEALTKANEELERRVAERTARLRETIAELEHYSYSISHDMRAPLRAMHQFSQILLVEHARRLAPEAQDFLHRIAAAAKRMDLLIQDVLTYSRVAQQPFAPEPVDLQKLITDIIQEYPGLQPPKAGVQLLSPLPTVAGNTALLTQCFSNLLNNAVKFVPSNVKPEVTVKAETVHGSARIWIEDNGIGIDPKDHDRIFNIYERVHGAHEYEGTGIGLSIVRKAVERLGGRAGLDSQLGKGSRFWIELPLLEPTPSPDPAAQTLA